MISCSRSLLKGFHKRLTFEAHIKHFCPTSISYPEPHKNKNPKKKTNNLTLEAKQALLQNMGKEQVIIFDVSTKSLKGIIRIFSNQPHRGTHPPYQNKWIFWKILHSLWPPTLPLEKTYCGFRDISATKSVWSLWRDVYALYDPISHDMHVVQQFNMVIGWKTYPEKTHLYHFHAKNPNL